MIWETHNKAEKETSNTGVVPSNTEYESLG